MHFEEGHIYHIYNQGNNRQRIFFHTENYRYFIRKMETYLLPYGDIIAYCLMPNHFHWMMRVQDVSLAVSEASSGVSLSDTAATAAKHRTLNDSIGILLRSYTNAINKQENRSGKLFREATKAECVTKTDGITPSFYDTNSGTKIYLSKHPYYPQSCFNYIHQNPVNARLVKQAEDWEFSSYAYYLGIRENSIICKTAAKELDIVFSP
jgi:putative transposase